MSDASVFFVGQPAEVAHHAAPLQSQLHIKIAEVDAVLSAAQPGDLAIFYSEHFDRFRHACQVLKQRNVATLYMIDGILEWRNAWENSPDEIACPYTMRPALAHKVACIGASQARIIDSWGNAGKTEIVGIPRIASHGDASTDTGACRTDETFRVLVMTAKTPGFTPCQIETVRQSLLDLKTWCANNSSIDCCTANPTRDSVPDSNRITKPVEFIWRLTGGLAESIGVTNQLSDLTGKELAEILPNIDAVISTPSTAVLEAMNLNLPVAVLDYHNCPHYVSAGWDICSAKHIGPTLQQMAQRDAKRMLFQQTQLADALYDGDDSSQRLAGLIQKMLDSTAAQIAQNPDQPISFPAAMLAPVAQMPIEFSHRKIFGSAEEFRNDETTVLQVELSHARREIQALHGDLAQIQSELEQAHQIFEQIEKHPIAGPIVRIRQKMLDLMTAMRKRKNEPGATRRATESNHSGSTPNPTLKQ
jgi:hypothetical protein